MITCTELKYQRLYMAVVAEIIWYKADFMRANHNNEDFSALINYWRLFLCVGLKEREIKFWGLCM